MLPGVLARRLVPFAALLALGCQSDAAFESTGGRIDLRMLPGGQLEVGGKVMSRAEFMLEIRRQVRALGDDREAAPLVAVRAELGVTSGEVDLLLRELRNAGIWRVNLGT